MHCMTCMTASFATEQYWNEDHQYEEIILHIGTNDLVHEKTDKVADEMEALINTVKTDTKNIAVASVVKRYNNKVNASDISHYLTIIRRRRGDYRGIFTETKSR